MKDWMTVALNVLVMLVLTLASVLLYGRIIKSRTLLTVWRFYLYLVVPSIPVFCLINIGWHLAVVSSVVGALVLAATHLYVVLLERPAERAQSIKNARLGLEPVIYLRSFALADAMRGIEKLLETSAKSFEAKDNLRFQLNPVALGLDDRAGFPKLTTPDSDWWGQFEDITAKSAAIFLLPITARADPDAGIRLEMAYVYMRYFEKLIVIVPDADSWQRVPRAPGESFDAPTKWNEVRATLQSVRPSVSIPEYHHSGFVFYLSHSGTSGWTCYSFSLSTDGVQSALSEVTRERRDESNRARKNFESEFKALNGMSFQDYYSGPGKKLPPTLPL